MPAMSNHCCIQLMLCQSCKFYSLELVDLVDLRRCNASVIAVDCMLNKLCLIMGLKTSDYPLVHRLHMGCKIWFEVNNVDVFKTNRNNVA
jgi:hypothetical protein